MAGSTLSISPVKPHIFAGYPGIRLMGAGFMTTASLVLFVMQSK